MIDNGFTGMALRESQSASKISCSCATLAGWQVPNLTPAVPNEVAGPVCAQTSPTACWADISFNNGGSSLFVTRHLAELDLNVTGTVVVLGRRTYDVGVQERLEVLMGVLNGMCPMGH